MPLDLKFGGLKFDVDGSKFEIRSSRRLGIGSLQLDSKPGSSLEGVDAKFAVDLKFGDCIRSWLEVRREFAARLRSPLYSKPGSN